MFIVCEEKIYTDKTMKNMQAPHRKTVAGLQAQQISVCYSGLKYGKRMKQGINIGKSVKTGFYKKISDHLLKLKLNLVDLQNDAQYI